MVLMVNLIRLHFLKMNKKNCSFKYIYCEGHILAFPGHSALEVLT